MKHTNSVPSRALRAYSLLARWALILTMSVWCILMLLWATLYWVIVPRINDFRVQIESQASQALGLQVRIGTIEAYQNGLVPSVELRGVRLLDQQGRDALVLGKVVTSVSPQSALRLGFEQLFVESPVLELRKTAEGKVFIGGIELGGPGQGENPMVDWLFSQREIVIRNGSLRWTDESRLESNLTLSKFDLLLKNGFRTHQLQLQAELPSELGRKVQVMGDFRQPIISTGNGKWKEWSGQIYTELERLDLAQVERYSQWGSRVGRGYGALRGWLSIDKGAPIEATADLAMSQVEAKLAADLKPLQMRTLQGRVSGQTLPNGFVVATKGLQFETQDGVVWPGGNLILTQSRVNAVSGAETVKSNWALKADQLDLTAITQLANYFPLAEVARKQMAVLSPQGRIVMLDAQWKAENLATVSFEDVQAKAKLTGLTFASLGPNLPAMRAANLDIEYAKGKGKAKLVIDNGELDLAGLIDRPRLLLKNLVGDVVWQIAGDQISVQIPSLKFSNSDGQGELEVKWRTREPDPARGRGRFPGILDLQASLSHAEAASLPNYLPVLIKPEVRDYLRLAIRKGQATGAKFRIKGDLYDFPFVDAKQGEFRISANMADVQFNYVPVPALAQASLGWPELTAMSGEFVLDRNQLHINKALGRLAMRNSSNYVQINKAEAHIPDLLNNPTVNVLGEARGSVANMLQTLNTSALRDLTGRALLNATGTGNAELKLKLSVPVLDFTKVAVQGALTLTDSDIRVSVDTPRLSRVRGVVNFSETGFALNGLQARLFGGDAVVSGGTQPTVLPGAAGARPPAAVAANVETGEFVFPPISLRVSGNLSADALRQAPELGLLARVAEQASGQTDFVAVLGIKQGQTEMTVTSSLVGLALKLPQPMGKDAQTALLMRYQSLPVSTTGATDSRDLVRIDIGRLASFSYLRDTSVVPAKVLRGSIAMGLTGDEEAPMPNQGVYANLNLNQVDVDAWMQQFSRTVDAALPSVLDPPAGANNRVTTRQAAVRTAVGSGAASPVSSLNANMVAGYLPSVYAVRATELTLGGRKVNKLVLGGSHEGPVWRANLEATEIDGYVEYRQPGPNGGGRVFARLARLTLAQQSVKEVEALLEEQPVSIPALDVMVEDLQLRDKKLGRLELEATNSILGPQSGAAREWRLGKLNLQMPEATLTAKGNWAALNAQNQAATAAAARTNATGRRTVMNFRLDIADSGRLLERFGMKEVIRSGKGAIEGQVAWLGSPLLPDYASMGGGFTVNVESGQFLKADPGIAKLLGVLSLQSLPRRLTLDFRDVFTEGFSFDFVRGDVKIEQGIASTNNLQMKGVNAAVLMEGKADIARETQQLRVVVVPELNAGTASLVATVINPVVGIGTFLAQLILRRPLIESATQEFVVDGTWIDPRVTRVPRKTAAQNEPPMEKTQ